MPLRQSGLWRAACNGSVFAASVVHDVNFAISSRHHSELSPPTPSHDVITHHRHCPPIIGRRRSCFALLHSPSLSLPERLHDPTAALAGLTPLLRSLRSGVRWPERHGGVVITQCIAQYPQVLTAALISRPQTPPFVPPSIMHSAGRASLPIPTNSPL